MKKAFTMLELVFVIVIIGIMSALMIPDMQSSKLREAAIQVISHIRYTQHLAMVDDKYDKSDTDWFKGRWQIKFSKADSMWGYAVFSDATSYNKSPDEVEIASNPASRSKKLYGSGDNSSKSLNLTSTFGISGVEMLDGCAITEDAKKMVAFDYIGRPLEDLDDIYGGLIVGDKACVIKLTHPEEGTLQIAIKVETGYACILNDDGDACIL